MKYEFNIVPIGKPRMVRSDRWTGRKCVNEYYVFKDRLKIYARAQHFELPEILDILFVLPMPDSWSKKKKQEMANKPHKQRPDIDNMMKAFFDCLVEEDSNIHSVLAKKVWGEEGKIVVITN